MSNLIRSGIALLLMNGCASQIKYSSLPDNPNCGVPFRVIDVGNPNYDDPTSVYFKESTLNGKARQAVLQFEDRYFILIVDPDFPQNTFDKWAAENLVTSVIRAKNEEKELKINCTDYRRITTPLGDDGIYLNEIN